MVHFLSKTGNRMRFITWFIFLCIFMTAVAVSYFFLTEKMLPFQLKSSLVHEIDDSQCYLYHDFNQDGYSERLFFKNLPDRDRFNIIFEPFQRTYDYKVGEQFNLDYPFNINRLFFADYTGDDFDEVFLISHSADSIYLSVIDVDQKAFILKEWPLAGVSDKAGKAIWDLRAVRASFADLDGDGRKEFIYTLHTAFPYYPRGIYAFDIAAREQVRCFEIGGTIKDLYLFDLNQDGRQEIIFTSQATGNIDDPVRYGDDTCHLFVLDHDFRPVFKPLSRGTYPSSLLSAPLHKDGRHYLLAAYRYVGELNKPNMVYLVDQHGIVVNKKAMAGYAFSALVPAPYRDKPFIYFSDFNGRIGSIDKDLRIQYTAYDDFHPTDIEAVTDLDHDGIEEIITTQAFSIEIFSNTFELLAQKEYAKNIKHATSLRYSGLDNSIAVAVHSADYFQLNQYLPNFWHNRALILSLSIALIVTMGTFLSYRGFQTVYIYFRFFTYSLYKTQRGILILTSGGKVKFVNTLFTDHLNMNRSPKTFEELLASLPEKPDIRHALVASFESGNRQSVDFTIPEKHFEGRLNLVPLKGPLGSVYAYLAEIEDLTAPFHSDRMKAWTKTVQKMAHDMKQPLSPISLNLYNIRQLLETMEFGEKDTILENIRLMRTELDRINQLSRNFIRFVELRNPDIRDIDIEKLLADCIAHFSGYIGNNLSVEVDIEPDVSIIQADPQLLEMVLNILIENAIDAMQGKGRIRISLMLAQFLQHPGKSFVQIEVTDDGPGIDEKNISRIFDPYFTTKKDGVGIGLSIAKKFIEDHRGEMDVYSKLHLGTTFRLILPLSNGDRQKHDAKIPHSGR